MVFASYNKDWLSRHFYRQHHESNFPSRIPLQFCCRSGGGKRVGRRDYWQVASPERRKYLFSSVRAEYVSVRIL